MADPTYTRYILHSLLPATGWCAVYWDADQQLHYTLPVHALALATLRIYDAVRQDVRLDGDPDHEDEDRTVVALEYNPSDDWSVCDEARNYCGLVPPDWTMEDFLGAAACGHPGTAGVRPLVVMPEREASNAPPSA